MVPVDGPVDSPARLAVVGSSDAPAVLGPRRRALFPLMPRFAWRGGRVDVCAVIDDGALEFVVRDVLAAVGLDLGDYATDLSHEAPTTFAEHATARTWSRDMIADTLSVSVDGPTFLSWLDGHVRNLEAVGLAAMERKTLYGSGQRTEAPSGEPSAIGPVLPAFYSVAAAAKILSRDPGIGRLGRDGLFEQLHKLAWIERAGTEWKPARDLVLIGYLLTQHVAVPKRPEAYPQLLITAFGMEALHVRLGGTAPFTLRPSDHLTLIGD